MKELQGEEDGNKHAGDGDEGGTGEHREPPAQVGQHVARAKGLPQHPAGQREAKEIGDLVATERHQRRQQPGRTAWRSERRSSATCRLHSAKGNQA